LVIQGLIQITIVRGKTPKLISTPQTFSCGKNARIQEKFALRLAKILGMSADF
jgi:hypothetical protein